MRLVTRDLDLVVAGLAGQLLPVIDDHAHAGSAGGMSPPDQSTGKVHREVAAERRFFVAVASGRAGIDAWFGALNATFKSRDVDLRSIDNDDLPHDRAFGRPVCHAGQR